VTMPGSNRRRSIMRRDMNDLIRSPDGKVSEAKMNTVLFKAAMLYVFLKYTQLILADWMLLAVFVTTLVAPDLMKKVLAQKAGLATTKEAK
jgi:hypothetical protein